VLQLYAAVAIVFTMMVLCLVIGCDKTNSFTLFRFCWYDASGCCLWVWVGVVCGGLWLLCLWFSGARAGVCSVLCFLLLLLLLLLLLIIIIIILLLLLCWVWVWCYVVLLRGMV